LRDPVSIRKWLSLWGEKLLGAGIKGYLVRQYDYIYYRLLFSESTELLRKKLRRLLGNRGEMIVARIFYGAFLAKPYVGNRQSDQTSFYPDRQDPCPLFFNAENAESGKITLLIVTAWLNQGGVEQEIIELCNNLNPSRFRVIIATTRRSSHPWENILRSSGASIYHLADFLTPHSIRHGLAHLVLQHGVEAMHIVHSREAYESLSFIKRLCPFLSVSDRSVTLAGGFPKISARVGRKNIDIRTVGHKKLAQQMSRSYGLASQTLRVVYAGTDQRRLPQLSSRNQLHALCNLSREVPIVLYLGRLDPEKRPDVFVRMATKVCKMRPDSPAHFAIVGDGKMRGDIEALINKLGMKKRIHLLGFQPNGPELIWDSAMLIITSRYEGLALVSFEAMTVGTPQISADVGGQSELITPEIGILIKNGFGEVARYARACIELLYDPTRRERMSLASKRKLSLEYSTEDCVNEYGKIFQELADMARRRAIEIPSLRPPHIDPLHIFG
jgi:glycosyltransferase involved in cell wall biosynthesis